MLDWFFRYPDYPLGTNAPYYAGYFQDDYRLTSKLTLNLGLVTNEEAGLSEAKRPLRCRIHQNATNPLQATSGVTTKGGIEFAGQKRNPQRL